MTFTLLALALSSNLAHATTYVGTRTIQDGQTTVEKPYSFDLDGEDFRDSLGNSGSFLISRNTARMSFDDPNLVAGGFSSAPLDCWEQVSGLNPAIGEINVCLLEAISNLTSSCGFDPLACTTGVTSPTDSEFGHFLASRMTVGPADFSAVGASYTVWQEPGVGGQFDCDATLPHLVQTFIGGVAPAGTPVLADEQLMSPVGLASGAFHELQITYPMHIDVPAGSYLYLSVEMVGDPGSGSRVCPGLDFWGPHVSAGNWWSNSDSTPYPWVQLDSFGGSFEMDFVAVVRGVHTL